jgi:hypothetical protein
VKVTFVLAQPAASDSAGGLPLASLGELLVPPSVPERGGVLCASAGAPLPWGDVWLAAIPPQAPTPRSATSNTMRRVRE